MPSIADMLEHKRKQRAVDPFDHPVAVAVLAPLWIPVVLAVGAAKLVGQAIAQVRSYAQARAQAAEQARASDEEDAADAAEADAEEAERIADALDGLHDDVEEAEGIWQAAESKAQAVLDQIDQRMDAMKLILSQFGQQHAARTARSLDAQIGELTEQWADANDEALEAQQRYGALRARLEEITGRLSKSLPGLALELKALFSQQPATPGAHALYR